MDGHSWTALRSAVAPVASIWFTPNLCPLRNGRLTTRSTNTGPNPLSRARVCPCARARVCPCAPTQSSCCVHLLERFQGRAFGDGAGQGDSAVVADRVDLETVTSRPPRRASWQSEHTWEIARRRPWHRDVHEGFQAACRLGPLSEGRSAHVVDRVAAKATPPREPVWASGHVSVALPFSLRFAHTLRPVLELDHERAAAQTGCKGSCCTCAEAAAVQAGPRCPSR